MWVAKASRLDQRIELALAVGALDRIAVLILATRAWCAATAAAVPGLILLVRIELLCARPPVAFHGSPRLIRNVSYASERLENTHINAASGAFS